MTLRASQCHSLKDKRAVLRKLVARVRSQYHVPLAEVGAQNTWQRIVIGFAVVGSDRVSVERTSTDIARFIERTGLAEMVGDQLELLAYGDGPMGEDASPGLANSSNRADIDHENGAWADESWIPESWKSEEAS